MMSDRVEEGKLRLGVVLEAEVFAGPVAVDFDQALVEEEAFVSSPLAAVAPGGGMIGIAEAMVDKYRPKKRPQKKKNVRKGA